MAAAKRSKLPTRRSSTDLTNYDPVKGLKRIAVAEAAEKYSARAKDATKLFVAIEAKLTAQRDFVAWWDAQEKNPGTRYGRSRSATAITAGKGGIPDRYIIERWREKLADDDRFTNQLEKANLRCVQMLEMQRETAAGAHVGQNTGENEWYTPSEYIEAARLVLGAIDLDPASTDAANAVVKAAQIFTLTDNGLEQDWHGRVWMNPPYSHPEIEQFCSKLARHVDSGDISAAIVLVNNATETAWFQDLAVVATALCFPRGRVKFWNPKEESATPLQGQALLYTGPAIDRFTETFAAFGLILVTR